MRENIYLNELQRESWVNMSRCKLTDYFKPGNNKNVRQDVDSTVENQPVTETTILQDKEAVTIEENKPFDPSDDFGFPKRKFGERQHPCQTHWFQQFQWLHYDEQ